MTPVTIRENRLRYVASCNALLIEALVGRRRDIGPGRHPGVELRALDVPDPAQPWRSTLQPRVYPGRREHRLLQCHRRLVDAVPQRWASSTVFATQYYANTHPSIGKLLHDDGRKIITNNDSYASVVTGRQCHPPAPGRWQDVEGVRGEPAVVGDVSLNSMPAVTPAGTIRWCT